MRTYLRVLLFLGLINLATPVCHAEVASGTYTQDFTGAINLWDISGSYNEDLGGISVDYTLNTEPSGKFTGQGTADVQDTDVNLHADFTLSGSVKTAGDVTRVTIALKMKGSGQVSGHDATFSASLKEKLEIDSINLQMTGTASGSV